MTALKEGEELNKVLRAFVRLGPKEQVRRGEKAVTEHERAAQRALTANC